MFNLLTLRHTLRQRLGAVVAAVAASAGCCVCGLVLTFVMAPRQALQAWSISRLPEMGAAEINQAVTGQTLLFTGVLEGNAPLRAGSDLVVYEVAEWEVTLPSAEDSSDAKPSGAWRSHAPSTPQLTLTVDGQAITISGSQSAQLDGALREEVVPGDSGLVANDNGTPVPDGTLRYRGLADGDLATVLGYKSSAAGVALGQLFAGDRVAFEASQRQAASNFLIAGLFSIIMAPIVLIGGVLAALLGRRR